MDTHLQKLIQIAFKNDEKASLVQQRTKDLSLMATMARLGQKDTPEFKELHAKHSAPVVTDFSSEVHEIQKLITHLKKFQ
jgi:hypothetical protein